MIKWRGTTYRFHPLFVIMMCFSIATGYFLELITLFGIVFVHEMGHVAAAKGLGWSVKEVQLLPFGGVAVVDEPGSIPAREEIIVALAGPLQNAVMAGAASVLHRFGVWDDGWGQYFIQANVLIGLFNLLPILPLDGGRVMQALLSYALSFHRSLMCCVWISLLLSLFVVFLSLIHMNDAGIQLNLLIIGLFLFYSNWHGYRNIPFSHLRFLMNRGARTGKMIEKGALAQPIVVYKNRSVAQIVRLFMRERYHLIYVLNEKGAIQAVLPEQRIIATYFIDNKPGAAVSELIG